MLGMAGQSYELTTVTFGVKSSPFLALRTVRQLARDEARRFPLASARVNRELYMDDVVSSVPDVEGALALYRQWVDLFKAGGFQLTKWSTNSKELLSKIPTGERRGGTVEFPSDILTVLGLRWDPDLDDLIFQVDCKESHWSKRSVLSTMARIWDPLGMLAPVTVAVKLFMKRLWSLQLDWDDPLPAEDLHSWQEFIGELPGLSALRVPRHLGVAPGNGVRLVGFADASEKAYAAVIYLVVDKGDGIRESRLLCAKTKVAPTKFESIPRLELCGALLLAKVLSLVLKIFQRTLLIQRVYALSDSTVVLQWLRGPPHRWKTFVANRVVKVQDYLPDVEWLHVRSEDNPADSASRGLSPEQLLDNSRWWVGPEWLTESADRWPVTTYKLSSDGTELEERPNNCLVATVTGEPIGELLARNSSWSKALRVVICMLRFGGKLPRGEGIKPSDYETAERALIRFVQQDHFSGLIQDLRAEKEVDKGMRVLTPFLQDGIIRVGGRLRNTSMSFAQRHPILLPKKSNLTVLLINYIHLKHLHAGLRWLQLCYASGIGFWAPGT